MIEKVYYVNNHRYGYRGNEPAEIIGVKMYTPEGKTPRLCYEVEYSDGTRDYRVVDEEEHYHIITFNDIINGNIPEIIN